MSLAAGGDDEASADLRQRCFGEGGNDVLQSSLLCFLMNHSLECWSRKAIKHNLAQCGHFQRASMMLTFLLISLAHAEK